MEVSPDPDGARHLEEVSWIPGQTPLDTLQTPSRPPLDFTISDRREDSKECADLDLGLSKSFRKTGFLFSLLGFAVSERLSWKYRPPYRCPPVLLGIFEKFSSWKWVWVLGLGGYPPGDCPGVWVWGGAKFPRSALYCGVLGLFGGFDPQKYFLWERDWVSGLG